jgi:hypothetical protein
MASVATAFNSSNEATISKRLNRPNCRPDAHLTACGHICKAFCAVVIPTGSTARDSIVDSELVGI